MELVKKKLVSTKVWKDINFNHFEHRDMSERAYTDIGIGIFHLLRRVAFTLGAKFRYEYDHLL